MAIFKPARSNNFHYSFMVNRKVYSATCGTANRALAVKFEAKRKEEVYNEVHLGVGKTNEITLSAALDQYFEDTEHQKVIKSYHTSKTKLLGFCKDRATKKQLKVFGFADTTLMHELTDRDLQRLVTARRKEGVGNASILYDLGLLSVVIAHAKRLGFKTPTLDFDELKKANKIKPTTGRLRYLTLDEENSLLYELNRVSESDNGVSGIQRQDTLHFVMMLLDTGARHGELAGLKWESIDMDKKEIRLFRPKVQNESVLMMSNRVFDMLTSRLTVKHKDQEYVFEGRFGGHRVFGRTSFESACQRAKLKEVTYHTLRHTFASRMVQAQVPIYSVQHLLGHTNVSTTARYAHLAPQHAATEAARVLNQLQGA